ncbi:MAG: hypothetical protein ACYTXA_21935 [Nostoc sp.]
MQTPIPQENLGCFFICQFLNKKLHPLVGGVFGHGEWGRSYLFGPCPMPQGLGRLFLSTHFWDGLSRRFQ